jgi:hypothetical protein
MFDFTINEDHSDRDLLVRLLKELHAMAVDLSKLNAAVARNTAAVDALVNAHQDPAAQVVVDAATDAVNAAAAKAEAAAAPPAPPAG